MASSWKGAIDFAGFPVMVELHTRVKTPGKDGFKMLGSDDKPIKQVLVESGEFEKLEKDPFTKVSTIGRNDTNKGIEVGVDEYKPIPSEMVEQIGSLQRSTKVEPLAIVPVASLPLALASKSYIVVPDSKGPAPESVNQLWNGLRDMDCAYVTQLTVRAGGRDQILAVYATDEELLAVALPYEEELNDGLPSYEFTEDAKAAKLFRTVIESEFTVGDFDITQFDSTHRALRAKAIQSVLEGTPLPKAKQQPTPPKGEDLMARLERMASDVPKGKAKKAPAKKKAAPRKKAKATK